MVIINYDHFILRKENVNNINRILTIIASLLVMVTTGLFSFYIIKDHLPISNCMIYLFSLVTFIVIFSFLNILQNNRIDLYKKIIFIAYSGYIIIFLFIRTPMTTSDPLYNLVPFSYGELNFSNIEAIEQTIFNFMLFLPFGFIKKNNIMLFMLIFITLEIMQMYFKVGIFDITDIIFYLMGFLAGKAICYLWYINLKN